MIPLEAWVGLAIVLAISLRLFVGGRDPWRIRRYLQQRGGILNSCQWIGGTEHRFSDDDRYYTVTYTDAEGRLHHAICKTTFWKGILFTEDRIVSQSDSQTME